MSSRIFCPFIKRVSNSADPRFGDANFVRGSGTWIDWRSSWLCSGLVLAIGGTASVSALAQGGGNANAVGLALESSLESSAQTNAAQTSGTPGGSGGSGPGGGYGSSSGSGQPSGSGPGGGYGSGQSSGSGPGGGYGSSSGPPDGYGDGGSSDYGPMEMGGDGTGEMGYGSTGQSGANSAQRAQLAMSAGFRQVALGLANLFSASPISGDPQVSRSVTLWEQAALAFHQGDQKKALALFHAHVVADGDDAINSRAAADYSRLLKRPVWAVRFGISVHPRVPDALLDDPQPVREGMKVTGPMVRGRGLAAGGAASPDDSYGASGGPPQGADYGQGESMAMDARMSGAYGDGMGGAYGDGMGGMDGAAPSKPVVTTLGGTATEEVNKKLDRNLGLVADVTNAMFTERQNAGKFGHALDGLAAAGAEQAALRGDTGNTTPSDLPMWIPGVDYVGEGTYSDMLAIAKKSEIDVLMHFDIVVKEVRNGSPSYATRCRLFQVENGETLGVSKAIDKFEIASGSTPVREAVQAQLANLFEIIDKKASVEPMPALQASSVAARIDSLLATNKGGSMRSLAEMVMFRSKDLITPEQLDNVFFFAGGEDALLLLHEEIEGRYTTANNRIDQELNIEAPK